MVVILMKQQSIILCASIHDIMRYELKNIQHILITNKIQKRANLHYKRQRSKLSTHVTQNIRIVFKLSVSNSQSNKISIDSRIPNEHFNKAYRKI